MKKKQHHWLDIAEYATLIGLGLGSVVSFASSQFFYSSAPLSLLILLNLANRNRLEEVSRQTTNKSLEDIDQRMTRNLELLHQQIQTLPTPEALGGLRKSMLVKNRELAERLAGEIRTLQEGVQSVLQGIDQLNLGTVRQDLDGLRDQYGSLNEGVATLTTQFQQLSASGRFEDMERAIAQLQSDSKRLQNNLQNLADQTKPTLTSLQDQINHLNRQFQKLPPPFDSTALRQEVTELVRVVADLVPKREWSTLVTELQSLQQQQESQSEAEESLRRKLQEISQQLQSRPTKSSLTSLQNQINHLNRQFQKLPPPFDPTSLKREVAKLLKVVADLVPRRDFSGLMAQVKALQQQQEFQMKVEQTLRAELHALNEQLQNLVVDTESLGTKTAAPAAAPAQQEFQSRLEAMLQREMAQISQQLENLPPTGSEFQAQVEAVLRQELLEVNRQLQAYSDGAQYEFILDLKALSGNGLSQSTSGSSDLHDSRSILEAALEQSQERLIVILPWSSQVSLDDELMARMEAFLQKNRRLDLGWCHQADRTQERLLKPIHQRWQLRTDNQDELQATLQKLLHLKRSYPQVLQFKVLGTRENFLVSDHHYAVLGLEDAVVGATSLPEVELKLRTTDGEAVQQFIQRFDNPVLRSDDAAAYWNRAVTRFDLGDRQGALDDCNQILAVTPDDAFALNFRGIIRYDMGDRQNAIADFNQSLQANPQQTAAYCNRGYIKSELGDQLGAIADYSAALRVDAQSAVTSFLRGMACQKFGELEGAIADYTEALRLAPDSAILYYYRGLARPKQGEYEGAIADLNRALELFTQRGNEINARKVFNYLQQLQQTMQTRSLETANAVSGTDISGTDISGTDADEGANSPVSSNAGGSLLSEGQEESPVVAMEPSIQVPDQAAEAPSFAESKDSPAVVADVLPLEAFTTDVEEMSTDGAAPAFPADGELLSGQVPTHLASLEAEEPVADAPLAMEEQNSAVTDSPAPAEFTANSEGFESEEEESIFSLSSIHSLASLFEDEDDVEIEAELELEEDAPASATEKPALDEKMPAPSDATPSPEVVHAGVDVAVVNQSGNSQPYRNGGVDPATLTLSNFAEDLTFAEELNPFTWEIPESMVATEPSDEVAMAGAIAPEEGSLNGTNGNLATMTDEPDEAGGTLSDFCSQF